jgi:hypothetical protein
LKKKQVDSLKEKLNMKMSALNAIKSNGFQQDDSKVVNLIFFYIKTTLKIKKFFF